MVQLCIDLNILNKEMEFDAELMSTMEEAMNRITGNKFSTKIDLCKGYLQVCLSKNCFKILTSIFETSNGLFQFKTMPFGLIYSGPRFAG